MATLQKRKNGYWELQYRANGQRKTITFSGQYTKRIADRFSGIVEVLVRIMKNRDPTLLEREDRDWIEKTFPELGEKLAKVGLYVMPTRYTLKELWDTYLEKRADKKESTLKTYLDARRRFFAFFKEDELLTSLTQDRMKEWKQFLLDSGKYAVATVSGTINKCKAAFNWAKRQKWLTSSPLEGIGSGSDRNKAKDRYVKPSEYRRLLDACPCQEWRTVLALARVAGLHPNELETLR